MRQEPIEVYGYMYPVGPEAATALRELLGPWGLLGEDGTASERSALSAHSAGPAQPDSPVPLERPARPDSPAQPVRLDESAVSAEFVAPVLPVPPVPPVRAARALRAAQARLQRATAGKGSDPASVTDNGPPSTLGTGPTSRTGTTKGITTGTASPNGTGSSVEHHGDLLRLNVRGVAFPLDEAVDILRPFLCPQSEGRLDLIDREAWTLTRIRFSGLECSRSSVGLNHVLDFAGH